MIDFHSSVDAEPGSTGPLRSKRELPLRARKPQLPIIISLFSGAGGLDLGFKQEGFKIGVAFDVTSAAIKTHKRNFPKSSAILGDLIRLRPAGVLRNVRASIPVGSRIGIIGGPPCQGFSRANARSKVDDPRNDLPKLYVKIIRALQQSYRVEFIVFENVLGMRDVKHARKYRNLVRGLRRLDLHVAEQELCALDFGVPQTRRRIILSGIAKASSPPNLRPRRRSGAKSVYGVSRTQTRSLGQNYSNMGHLMSST